MDADRLRYVTQRYPQLQGLRLLLLAALFLLSAAWRAGWVHLHLPGHAARWLRRPNRALNGELPIDLLDTDVGARQIEDVLGRIAHGVVS